MRTSKIVFFILSVFLLLEKAEAVEFSSNFERMQASFKVDQMFLQNSSGLGGYIENKDEIVEKILTIAERSKEGLQSILQRTMVCINAQVSFFINLEQGICFRLSEKEFYRMYQSRLVQPNDLFDYFLFNKDVGVKAVLRADLVFYSGFPERKPNHIFSCWRGEFSDGVGGNAFACVDVTRMAKQKWSKETIGEKFRDIMEQVLPAYLLTALFSQKEHPLISLIGAGLTAGIAYEGLAQTPTLRLEPMSETIVGSWIEDNILNALQNRIGARTGLK